VATITPESGPEGSLVRRLPQASYVKLEDPEPLELGLLAMRASVAS
jgi:hypothetical protein